MTSAEPRSEISAKQSPPTPVEPASTMHCTAHAVTAASMALPPSRMASMAASVARACEVAAMPLRLTAGDRPGSSKFRMTPTCPLDGCETPRDMAGRVETPLILDPADRDSARSAIPSAARLRRSWTRVDARGHLPEGGPDPQFGTSSYLVGLRPNT